jgi:hypothetical protein
MMFGLIERLLRAIRHRRRWGDLAAAAEAAADAATADLDRRVRRRSRRRRPDERPPAGRPAAPRVRSSPGA